MCACACVRVWRGRLKSVQKESPGSCSLNNGGGGWWGQRGGDMLMHWPSYFILGVGPPPKNSGVTCSGFSRFSVSWSMSSVGKGRPMGSAMLGEG